jgi:nicotinate phosphoribosyltransferase
MTRTDPAVFNLPVQKLRDGYYADAYFNRARELLIANGRHPRVVMQVFQREHSFAGGVDEAIAMLKLGAGGYYKYTGCMWDAPGECEPSCPCPYRWRRVPAGGDGVAWRDGWGDLTVKALHEGDEISPWEPVLQIEGDYTLFAHLETTMLGVMARRSLVMRNVKEAIAAANGKPIWFFPARHDHWAVQTGDGIAAHQAGIEGVSTDAGASWWGGRGMGTIPHALIAAYGGDTVAAAREFAQRYKDSMNVTVLVDFHNDSVGTALRVAEELGDDLWGVRLDTSSNLVDYSIASDLDYGEYSPTGVNPRLVELVREALDDEGFEHVKIVVSGGFKAAKIREFERLQVPVDAYGVGSSLIRGSNDYTADIVMTDNEMCAKVGRWVRDDSRLEAVK